MGLEGAGYQRRSESVPHYGTLPKSGSPPQDETRELAFFGSDVQYYSNLGVRYAQLIWRQEFFFFFSSLLFISTCCTCAIGTGCQEARTPYNVDAQHWSSCTMYRISSSYLASGCIYRRVFPIKVDSLSSFQASFFCSLISRTSCASSALKSEIMLLRGAIVHDLPENHIPPYGYTSSLVLIAVFL